MTTQQNKVEREVANLRKPIKDQISIIRELAHKLESTAT